MLEVDGGLVRGLAAPLRVDNGPDRRIVHLLRERPGKAARSCRSDNVRDGRLRAAAREGDAFLAHPHRDQSEDFSVLDHSSFLSLDGHRRPFGAQVNSREGSGGGKSLRLSATRGMSIGDARNHHRTSAQEALRGSPRSDWATGTSAAAAGPSSTGMRTTTSPRRRRTIAPLRTRSPRCSLSWIWSTRRRSSRSSYKGSLAFRICGFSPQRILWNVAVSRWSCRVVCCRQCHAV